MKYQETGMTKPYETVYRNRRKVILILITIRVNF